MAGCCKGQGLHRCKPCLFFTLEFKAFFVIADTIYMQSAAAPGLHYRGI